ncbi:hypothetical protein NSTCB13_02828 [Nostoc sp. DSM 114160]
MPTVVTEPLALSFDCAVIERLVLSVVEVSRDSTTAKPKGVEVRALHTLWLYNFG